MNSFKIFYYVKQGYANYIVFIIAVLNLIVTSYYLAIKNLPALQAIFPNFFLFGFFILGTGIPITFGLGYWHYTKSGGQHNQIEVENDVNPITPVFVTTFLMLKSLTNETKFSPSELEMIKKAESVCNKYIEKKIGGVSQTCKNCKKNKHAKCKVTFPLKPGDCTCTCNSNLESIDLI